MVEEVVVEVPNGEDAGVVDTGMMHCCSLWPAKAVG